MEFFFSHFNSPINLTDRSCSQNQVSIPGDDSMTTYSFTVNSTEVSFFWPVSSQGDFIIYLFYSSDLETARFPPSVALCDFRCKPVSHWFHFVDVSYLSIIQAQSQ